MGLRPEAAVQALVRVGGRLRDQVLLATGDEQGVVPHVVASACAGRGPRGSRARAAESRGAPFRRWRAQGSQGMGLQGLSLQRWGRDAPWSSEPRGAA